MVSFSCLAAELSRPLMESTWARGEALDSARERSRSVKGGVDSAANVSSSRKTPAKQRLIDERRAELAHVGVAEPGQQLLPAQFGARGKLRKGPMPGFATEQAAGAQGQIGGELSVEFVQQREAVLDRRSARVDGLDQCAGKGTAASWG